MQNIDYKISSPKGRHFNYRLILLIIILILISSSLFFYFNKKSRKIKEAYTSEIIPIGSCPIQNIDSIGKNYIICCGKSGNLSDCTNKSLYMGEIIFLMINATKDFQIYDSYPILYEYTNIQPHEIQVNSYEEIRIGNEKFFMKSINARDIYEKTHSISITFFGKLNVSPVFFKLLLFPEMNITNKTQLLERIGQSKEILTWTGEVFEE